MPRWNRRPWIGRIALALLVPPLLLEIALQIGYVGVVLFAREPEDPARAGEPCAVLCVGDSFTFGLGTSEPRRSYPAVLEETLVAAPFRGRSRVVNGGWPGSTSREVLQELVRRLDTTRPTAVAVLVGINDLWKRPDRLADGDLDPAAGAGADSLGLRLEWRTLRLLKLILRPPAAAIALGTAAGSETPSGSDGAAPAATPPANPADPLIGAWISPNGEVEFRADGTARLEGRRLAWKRVGRDLEFVDAGDGTKTKARFQLKDEQLVLRLDEEKRPRRFRRSGTPDLGPTDDEEEAGGDAATELAALSRYVDAFPDDLRLRGKRIKVARRAGRDDLVALDVAQFEAACAEDPSGDLTVRLVGAYHSAGRIEDAGRVAKEAVKELPEESSLWFAIADAASVSGDFDAAMTAATRTLETGPDEPPGVLAPRFRLRAALRLRVGDVRGSVADTVSSWRLDHVDDRVFRVVRRFKAMIDQALIDQVKEDLALDPAAREKLQAIFVQATSTEDDATLATLEQHLRMLVELCRPRGIQPVILTYPFEVRGVEEVQERIAGETGATFVNLRERFESLQTRHSRDDLFVADGHCNDRGYAYVAAEVAAALARAR